MGTSAARSGRPGASSTIARTGSKYGGRVGRRAILLALSAVLAAGCGGGDDGPAPRDAASDPSPPVASGSGAARIHDWPMFGVTAARRNRYPGATGLGAAAARKLVRTRVKLPGTVDSSPLFLHGVRVN